MDGGGYSLFWIIGEFPTMATQLTLDRTACLTSQVKNTFRYKLQNACKHPSCSIGTFGIFQTVTSQQRATQSQKQGKASQAPYKCVTQVHSSLGQREQDQVPAYYSQGWNILYKTLFSLNTDNKQIKRHITSKPTTVVNIPVEFLCASQEVTDYRKIHELATHILNVSSAQGYGTNSKLENWTNGSSGVTLKRNL